MKKCTRQILKHQEHLDQRDERRQEGTLRRASSEKGRISSSTACPSVKKKKSSAKAVKASVPAPTLPSASTPSTSNSTDSSALALNGNLDLPNFERSDSGIRHFESEPIELDTINKPKVEEGMAIDLRVGFKERHYKCLHEAIAVDTPPAKRTYLEGVQEEPMRYASPTLVPPPDATRSSNVPTAEKKTGPTHEGAPGGVAPVEEGLDQNDTPASAPPPSREEMIEMLRQVPCFTDAEPPFTKMSDFFPFTKQISVNLGSDPPLLSQPSSYSTHPSLSFPIFSNCGIAQLGRLQKW